MSIQLTLCMFLCLFVDVCYFLDIIDKCLEPFPHYSKSDILLFTRPRGPPKYVKLNETTSTELDCYKLCCGNKNCNVAWYLNRLCITIECNYDQFKYCEPYQFLSPGKTSKYFMMRFPRSYSKPDTLLINFTTARSTVTVDKTTAALREIHIDVLKENVIRLPNNSITLTAKVKNGSINESNYEYKWKILSKPSGNDKGVFDGLTTSKLQLSNLIKGHYSLVIEVRSKIGFGSEKVNIDVKAGNRKNKPPIAKITPEYQKIETPNNLVLDGTGSTDDSKIASYHWETVKGPMGFTKIKNNKLQILEIKDIMAGNYTFKLTVKDDDGVSNSTTAEVKVLPGKDYPPKADPGENKIIYLPKTSVILNGTNSTDDKKIVSYQWTKVNSKGPSPDIMGAQTAILKLSNLQVGTYVFNLKVTDAIGQTSDKNVRVIVNKRVNVAPVAKASQNEEHSLSVFLPTKEAVLNGTESTDDNKIVRYKWEQVGGNPTLKITDSDKAVAYINDLSEGTFNFKLTVWDEENLSSSDIVNVKIRENKNQPPKARVNKKHIFTYLNSNLVKIDGSMSWDDHKIVKYQWYREDDSLAVGDILDNSNHKKVLLLANLLPGVYKFRLKVFDKEGLSNSTKTTITVTSSQLEHYLVEMQFKYKDVMFTESKKKMLIDLIELSLNAAVDVDWKKAKIIIVKLDRIPFTSSFNMLFYCILINKNSKSDNAYSSGNVSMQPTKVSATKAIAHSTSKNTTQKTLTNTALSNEYMDALYIVRTLSKQPRFGQQNLFSFYRIETYVCQNNCSHHGKCNPITKFCECETFWTSSVYREKYGDRRPNCDWSIVYLIILFILSLVALGLLILVLLWIKRKKCRTRKNQKERKNKYARVREYNYKSKGDYSSLKVPKSLINGIKIRSVLDNANDSLLDSDAENYSSESEATLFTNSTGSSLPNNRKDKHSSQYANNNGNSASVIGNNKLLANSND